MKKIYKSFIVMTCLVLALVSIALVGCNNTKIESITLTDVTIKVEEEKTLTATIKPDDAKDVKLTWSSDDESKVTVDSNGKVKGIAAGSANITAEADGVKGTCKVTVTETPATVAVSSITLDKTDATVVAGQTVTLTATVAPDNATDETVTWTSDNTDIATVANGVVTGVAAGTATITAKAGDKTATCTVTVTAKLTGITTEADLRAAIANGGNISLGGNIAAVAAQFVVEKAVTIDLNGHNITESITWSDTDRTKQALFDLGAATANLTIKDSNTTTTGSIKSDDVYLFRVGTDGANGVSAALTIQKGIFEAGLTAVQVTKGTATIEGGEFSIKKNTGANATTQPYATTYGTRYLLNCLDANYNATTKTANIVVKAGAKFTDYDPMNSLSEGNTPVSFLASNLYTTKDENNVYTVTATTNGTTYVGTANDLKTKLAEAHSTAATIVLTNDVTVTDPMDVNGTVTLDLNGRKISENMEFSTTTNPVKVSIFDLKTANGNLTITGNGTVESNDVYLFRVGAKKNGSSSPVTYDSANLTIENGTFNSYGTIVQVTSGYAEINGGEYSLTNTENFGTKYLLNCVDDNYKNRTASISVKGGTFNKFNPQSCEAEGAHTDFVAPEYTSKQIGTSGNYEVTAIPTTGNTDVTRITNTDTLNSFKAAFNTSTNDTTVLADKTIILDANVTGISETLKINNGRHVILDLNGHNITVDGTNFNSRSILFHVRYGKLTIIDSSSSKNGSINSDNNITFAMGTNANNPNERGSLNINVADTAKFSSDYEVVYVMCGTARISGGTFKFNDDTTETNKNFLLNRWDNSERALIELTGGRYEGFNPGADVAADPLTNKGYVKEGYEAKADGSSGNYTVSKKTSST